MKKFRYFFVIYVFVLIVGTKFFLVFSSEEIENFIYDLSGESQNLEPDQNFDLQENLIPSQDFILSGDNIYSGEDAELKSNQNFDLIQTLDTQQDIPNLKITEVFRDGTDEWIEISNLGPNIFSGSIVINGAKSSEIIVPSLSIQSNQSLILGDNCSIISNFSCVWLTGLAMSISDTSEIAISIFHSGLLLDSFFVDEILVNTYNNTDSSFEKIWINGELELIPSTLERSYNVFSGYLASPGKVNTLTLSGGGSTGSLTGFSVLPQLSITEVFRDGTDEWIEISNFGTSDFVGKLKIYGASTSPFEINNLFIQKDRSIIIGDSNNQLEDFSNLILHTLSISDSSTIAINILYSGLILDSFYVPQNFVNSINNMKTSFERLINSGNLITTITNTGRIYNLKADYILSGYRANPGKVWEIDENITNIASTGNGISLDISGLIIPINCGDFSNNPFQIVEIFPGDSQTSTYIELLGLSDFNGGVVFSGQGLRANFVENIDIIAGERILITDGLQGLLDEQKIIENVSLELASTGGWIGAFGQDGQVLDIIYFLNSSSSKSLYFDGNYAYCARILSKYDNYSPGFKETLLSYFPEGVPIYIDKIVYLAGGGGGSCPICLLNSGSYNNSGSSPFSGTSSVSGQLRIVSIDYDPEGSDTDRESVTLQSLSPHDLDLSDYRLQIVGKDSKKTVRGDIIHALDTETFIGNYQFPNTPSCINLLQENLIIDSYCYGNNQTVISTTNTGINGIDIFSGTQIFSGNFNIEIVSINYNPDGSDTNNESITLKLNGSSTINLSSFKLRINKDNKTTKKSISGILQAGQSKTFLGNYQFPNSTNDGKNVVVSLVYNDQYILDTYGYNPNIPTDLPSAGIYTVYGVVDGDTFKIKNGTKTTNIRLLGVDAPESSKTRYGYIECFGSQAKNYLKNLIDKKNIILQYDDSQIVDSYGRVLGYVFLSGQNINEKIIQDGYAREYTHNNLVYQYQSLLRSAQSFAQQNYLGLRHSSSCSGNRIEVSSGNLNIASSGYTTGNATIKIISLLPNPQGADKGNEKITLMYNYSGGEIGGDSEQSIDLSQGYYLLIGTRKKYLSGSLIAGKEKTFIGNYQFPNKASCVSIAKDKIILDIFCYDKADNGEVFEMNNGILSSISDLDLSILNSSKLQSFGSNLCLTYQGQIFHCKKMPSSKTSNKNQNKIKLYENYLNLIDDYLRQNRQVLFYNTDIKNYFNLLNEAKKNISKGIYYVNVNGEFVHTTDIVKRYDLVYNQTSYDYIVNVFKNNIVGMDIVDKYKNLKEEYFNSLAIST